MDYEDIVARVVVTVHSAAAAAVLHRMSNLTRKRYVMHTEKLGLTTLYIRTVPMLIVHEKGGVTARSRIRKHYGMAISVPWLQGEQGDAEYEVTVYAPAAD
jgi:hypothetical protein